MKARVKESPEGGAPAAGEAAPLRGDCAGVSISAATERRRGAASSMSSGGCLRKPATLQGRSIYCHDYFNLHPAPCGVPPEASHAAGNGNPLSQLLSSASGPQLHTVPLRAFSSDATAVEHDVAFLPSALIVAY